jgi:mucin-19
MANLRFSSRVACFVLCAVASGCSSSDSSSSPSSTSSSSSSGSTSSSSGSTSTGGTTYKGTFAGAGGDGGAIDVTVAAAGAKTQTIHILAVQQVTGTLHLSGGGSVTITGTFDDATKQLSITGGGYSFTGTATSDGVTGTYSGPKGNGTFTVFASASATPYCGTFAGGATGVWNFVVNEGKVAGSAVTDGGDEDTLTGTVTNGTIDMTTTNGSTADGAIEGTTATGTWKNVAGNVEGTWIGTAGCGG